MDDFEALGIALQNMAEAEGEDAVKKLVQHIIFRNLSAEDHRRIRAIIESVKEREPEAGIGPVLATKLYWQVALFIAHRIPCTREEMAKWE